MLYSSLWPGIQAGQDRADGDAQDDGGQVQEHGQAHQVWQGDQEKDVDLIRDPFKDHFQVFFEHKQI